MGLTQTRKTSTGLAGMTNLNLLAPIKDEMVRAFEPISYRERLHKVLEGLQAARRNVRESELMQPAFADMVGRFGIIHHFRYCIVPPRPGAPMHQQPARGTWLLSLNVGFDGGWEPYMRVIYRDLGPLLDLLLCHTVGYPGSGQTRFEEYCAWVRQHEVEGGLFYTDSAATLEDQAYLAEIEATQRRGDQDDVYLTRYARPSAQQRKEKAVAKLKTDPKAVEAALVLPLRTLKGLHRLSVYFAKGPDLDILRRFAKVSLRGARDIMAVLDGMPSPPRSWTDVSAQWADELELIKPFTHTKPNPPAPEAIPRAALQSHMLAHGENISHGCVVLLRVADLGKATKHLAGLAPRCGPLKQGDIGWLVGFTAAGLSSLRVHPKRLAALPQEFVDGMEARCGLLGDVRGNHPNHWPRPLAYGAAASGQRVEMQTVHVVVQLRLAASDEANQELHSRLEAEVAKLHQTERTGLQVLALQATRSHRSRFQQADETPVNHVTGHFGFADGLSQPVIDEGDEVRQKVPERDLVPAGELLLGRANGLGDEANPGLDELLQDGSFLVVRKLRQRVDHLHNNLAKLTETQREQALQHMMGRHKDGRAPVPLLPDAKGGNDFNYADASTSDSCPMHSHIRRSNPRDGREYTPRILRRGMSYGLLNSQNRDAERGVVFMAYCASIAEQFETIQRWVAGGNSTGVSSAMGDPFLRVPQAGENHTFRYVDNSNPLLPKVVRVEFDDKPLVQLEWGLYLLVPTLKVLGNLQQMKRAPVARLGVGAAAAAAAATKAASAAETKAETEDPRLAKLRAVLHDEDRAPGWWKRQQRTGAKTAPAVAYGRPIGDLAGVLAALRDCEAKHYSVTGYGQRMEATVGLNHLGIDHKAAPGSVAVAVNGEIEKITEKQAFLAASGVVQQLLAALPALPSLVPDAPERRAIDLVDYSNRVLAELCRHWVGLPDLASPGHEQYLKAGGHKPGKSDGVPRCPGNIASSSRYIFRPYPRDELRAEAVHQGRPVLKAIEDWLASNSARGPLTQAIQKGMPANAAKDELARVVSGVLLGFPPTVHGNFLRTAETWVESKEFWQLQQTLLLAAGGQGITHHHAEVALRGPLLKAMRARPVPEVLWRSPVDSKGNISHEDKDRVLLGMASALTDPAAPDELIFGRDDRDGKESTVHGCPGMQMGLGVLLAMWAGLMQAGTLHATGSPVLLILTHRTTPPPA